MSTRRIIQNNKLRFGYPWFLQSAFKKSGYSGCKFMLAKHYVLQQVGAIAEEVTCNR